MSGTRKGRARAEWIAAVRRERPRVHKAALPAQLDKFLDAKEQSSSLHVDEPFQVGTLSRARGRSSLEGVGRNGPVMFLSATEPGGVFGNERVLHDREIDLVGARHAAFIRDFQEAGERKEGHDFVVDDEVFHPYHGITRPRTSQMEVPPTLHMESAGKLLTPQQRRENLEFSKRAERARQLLKRIEADRVRTSKVLQTQYTHGVLGVDSTNNTRSPVYGARAEQLARVRAKTAELEARRRENLAHHSVSRARRGYDFLRQDTAAPTGEAAALFARKRRVDTAPGRFHDTHKRLFARDHARAMGVRRNREHRREFDIVSGVQMPQHVAPPIKLEQLM